jgi:hypothetical protein
MYPQNLKASHVWLTALHVRFNGCNSRAATRLRAYAAGGSSTQNDAEFMCVFLLYLFIKRFNHYTDFIFVFLILL